MHVLDLSDMSKHIQLLAARWRSCRFCRVLKHPPCCHALTPSGAWDGPSSAPGWATNHDFLLSCTRNSTSAMFYVGDECRQSQSYPDLASNPSHQQQPPERRIPLFGIPIVSYYINVLRRAWSCMDKMSIGFGPVQLQLPRLHTSSFAAVLGYVVLSAVVIFALCCLMSYARAIAVACIKWQLAQ
jgi:hypothetical protein